MNRVLLIAVLLLSILAYQNRNKYFLDAAGPRTRIHGKMESPYFEKLTSEDFASTHGLGIYIGSTADNVVIDNNVFYDTTVVSRVREKE